MKEVLDDALRDAPSVERVVVWRRAGAACPMTAGRDVWWDEVVAERAGGARAGGGRERGAVPPRVHVGHDGPSEGSAARPGRLPPLDRARDRVPGRSPRRRSRPLLDGHGLDHGPVDRRRRDGLRRHGRLHGRRARPAARPRLEARRGGARHDARRLADARPGARSRTASPTPTSRRSERWSRRASRGTAARTTGSTSTSAARAESRS